jgi:hypothetical protein
VIIVRLIGGLGNQMFQYSLGRHLAEANSTTLRLDVSGFEDYKLHRYCLHCFKAWQHFATIEEIESFKRTSLTPLARGISRVGRRFGVLPPSTSDFYQNARVIKENGLRFDPSVVESRGNLYLDGYWQSEKYFSPIREILLREFSFLHEPDARNRALAQEIQSVESVSLHIRRGDYASNALTQQVHGLCSMDYYRKAVAYIAQRVPDCRLYLFSDDHSWVRENLRFERPLTLIDHNDASRNYEDLRLMSLCRHNIVANSSFSWWGAWLNVNPARIVLSPERWFSDPALDSSDLIPESWTKVPG